MNKISLLLKFDDESRQTAEVYVEGSVQKELCRFLLDTGCAKTTLTRDRHTRDLPSIGKRESSGTFGRAEYDLVELTSLSVGPMFREKWVVSRAPEGGTDRHLFGMDVMRDHCLDFAFDNNEMNIVPETDARRELADQELIMERDLIPYIPVELGGKRGNAIWDSGASITLVDMKFVQQHPNMFVSMGNEIGTDSTNTQRETPIFMMNGLVVAGRKFQPLKVAAINFSISQTKIENPLNVVLGYSTLRQANWLFDFPRRKWAITKIHQ